MGCCSSTNKSTPKEPEAREEKTEIFEPKRPAALPETSDTFKHKRQSDGDAFILTFTRNKKPLTWKEFISESKAKSLSLVLQIQEAISRPNLEKIYFNCPPLTSDDLDNPVEFAILDAPLRSSTDVESFKDKFVGKSVVTSFNNFNADSLMVCPIPEEGQDVDIYSSLAPFIRSAPIKQQIAFWARVAKDLDTLISERTVWMNTAGDNVSFLHLRLDSKPKYYHYEKYENINYYTEKVDNTI